MAEPVPAGSDVSAGTYKCTNCGNEIQVGSTHTCRPARAAATASTRRSAAATRLTTRIRTASCSTAPALAAPAPQVGG